MVVESKEVQDFKIVLSAWRDINKKKLSFLKSPSVSLLKKEYMKYARHERMILYKIEKELSVYIGKLKKVDDDFVRRILSISEDFFVNIDIFIKNVGTQIALVKDVNEDNLKEVVSGLKECLELSISDYQDVVKNSADLAKIKIEVDSWKSSKFLTNASKGSLAAGTYLTTVSIGLKQYNEETNYIGIAGVSLLVSSAIMSFIYFVEYEKAVVLECEKSLDLVVEEKKNTVLNKFYYWLRSSTKK